MPSAMPETPNALQGLRVLDLSRVFSGPWTGQMLGDLGAEVVKVERPEAGDDSRRLAPFFSHPAQEAKQSVFFASANRNKKSITVDIATADGQALIRALAAKSEPAVVVGHSMGGIVATQAAARCPERVAALVYVAAFQPDVGESVGDLADKMPPANKSIGPVGDGYLAVNPEAFPADFAAGVPKPVADFMAISQVPIFGEALKAKVTVASWKDKPSYAVVAKQDRMINPDLERFMAKRAQSQTIELPGLLHAREVAALIEKAATAAK